MIPYQKIKVKDGVRLFLGATCTWVNTVNMGTNTSAKHLTAEDGGTLGKRGRVEPGSTTHQPCGSDHTVTGRTSRGTGSCGLYGTMHFFALKKESFFCTGRYCEGLRNSACRSDLQLQNQSVKQ